MREPRRATPTTLPTCRAEFSTPDAVPESFFSTALRRNGCNQWPRLPPQQTTVSCAFRSSRCRSSEFRWSCAIKLRIAHEVSFRSRTLDQNRGYRIELANPLERATYPGSCEGRIRGAESLHSGIGNSPMRRFAKMLNEVLQGTRVFLSCAHVRRAGKVGRCKKLRGETPGNDLTSSFLRVVPERWR